MADEVESIVVSKTVYTVGDFLGWQRDGGLDLRPYFQRGSVWTAKARSYLIDTLLRGYPVPVIYLQTKRDPDTLRSVRNVVDGQQRLRTVLSFVDPDLLPLEHNETPVTISRTHNSKLAGYTFARLSSEVRERILATEFSVHNLPAALPDATLLELFARLNSTGEKLNDQELRNAEFHGEFKTLAYSLAYEHVPTWKAWSLFTPRELAKMKDVELISELLLLIEHGVQAKSKAQLDSAYREWDDVYPQRDASASAFRRLIMRLDEANEPRRAALKSQSWFYAIAASVLRAEANATAATPMNVPRLRRALSELDARVKDLSALPDALQKALRGASTDKASRDARVDYFASILG